MSRTLAPGVIRGMQCCSSAAGLFHILAIDHRDSIRVVIDSESPETVPGTSITDVKLSIVRELAPFATAVMLDPVYSASQAIVSGALPGNVAFLSAVEEQGYLGNPLERETTLLAGWSVAKAKRLGAAGIKLLLFYHPRAGRATTHQEDLARSVAAECARAEIPLFLEPMFYSLDPHATVDSAQFAQQRAALVIETAQRLSALEPSVLKVPFPCDAKFSQNDADWKQACAALNDVCTVPWALLSGGDPFDTFKRQLHVACENGCSGFMAGRALWRDAVSRTGGDRHAFLRGTVLDRFKELVEITNRYGDSWTSRYESPTIDEAWYRTY